MRKPTICIGENEGADQLRSNLEACVGWDFILFPVKKNTKGEGNFTSINNFEYAFYMLEIVCYIQIHTIYTCIC